MNDFANRERQRWIMDEHTPNIFLYPFTIWDIVLFWILGTVVAVVLMVW